MEALVDWIADSRVSALFADVDWLVPAVQTLHILGIAAVFTLLTMINVRVLKSGKPGLGTKMPRSALAWVWGALGILIVTGLLMIIAEPARELLSNVFRLKMLLVGLLASLTWMMHQKVSGVSRIERYPVLGKTTSALSLALCVAIIAAGRLIAYI